MLPTRAILTFAMFGLLTPLDAEIDAQTRGARPAPSSTSRRVTPPSPTGRWQISTSKSEMTDTSTIVALLRADRPLTSRFGKPYTPALVLRCKEKTLEAYVSVDVVVEDSFVNRVRLDDGVMDEQVGWSHGTGRDSLFVGSPASFILSLAGHRTLRFGFDEFGAGEQIAVFTLTGLDSVVPRLQAACPQPFRPSAPDLRVEVSRSVDGTVWEVINKTDTDWETCTLSYGPTRRESKATFGPFPGEGRVVLKDDDIRPSRPRPEDPAWQSSLMVSCLYFDMPVPALVITPVGVTRPRPGERVVSPP